MKEKNPFKKKPHYFVLIDGRWRRFEGLPVYVYRLQRTSAHPDWVSPDPDPDLIESPLDDDDQYYIETSENRFVPYDEEQRRMWEQQDATHAVRVRRARLARDFAKYSKFAGALSSLV